MYKKVLDKVIPYHVQFRENRLKKKWEKRKKLIFASLQKEKKRQFNKWLKANQVVTKI